MKAPIVVTFTSDTLSEARNAMNTSMGQLCKEGYVVQGGISVSTYVESTYTSFNSCQNHVGYVLSVIMVKKYYSRSKKSRSSSTSYSS